MTTGLLQLSNECILLILEYLHPRQVRRIAQTCNRRLYSLAYPLLKPLKRRQCNITYFETLFGGLTFDDDEETFAETALKTNRLVDADTFTFSKPRKPTDHYEFLNFDDSLGWYEKIISEDDGGNEGTSERTDIAYTQKEVDRLIEQAEQLGLQLPAAFIKFMKDENLVEHLPTKMAWRVSLSPLHKVQCPIRTCQTTDAAGNTTSDDIEDGYVFTWYVDQQCCYYTSMYLDTSGRHAMLGSVTPAIYQGDEHVDDNDSHVVHLTDKDKAQGVLSTPMGFAADQHLEEIDFEHWLAHRYYEERIWFLVSFPEEKPTPDHVKRYLQNVYTEEGREMQ